MEAARHGKTSDLTSATPAALDPLQPRNLHAGSAPPLPTPLPGARTRTHGHPPHGPTPRTTAQTTARTSTTSQDSGDVLRIPGDLDSNPDSSVSLPCEHSVFFFQLGKNPTVVPFYYLGSILASECVVDTSVHYAIAVARTILLLAVMTPPAVTSGHQRSIVASLLVFRIS